MTLPRLLLLDTNILIHLVRENPTGRSIDSRFSLRRRTERSLISIVTVGETLALSKRLSWGRSKVAAMEALLQDLVVVDISDEVLYLYAEVDVFLRRAGKPIEQNDMWIAATAIASGAHLLTTDKDFDPLYPAPLDRTWIDPQRPDA
ncbi:MAG TPA: type II toxin-antitoxin system VapC family toxin [Thermoanaerobaculia bacterium]|nr:type II toxin-antitoxin system VapC family toxin [Thermoanaerobaculia bacterium]